jgi:porin
LKTSLIITILIFSLITPILALSQNDSASQHSAFDWEIHYIGDLVSNFDGGIKPGTMYLGLANLKLNFDLENAGWLKGGELFVNFANTHGEKPSEKLVGDFQGISNIEAGNLTFFYELWYKQRLGDLTLTAGFQDLNVAFASTESGSIFTNSSFGIQSSISDNIPTPIFPITALGLLLEWKIDSIYSIHTAIFDGTPDHYKRNPVNLNWKLSEQVGFLTIGELRILKSFFENKIGIYKFGGYFYNHNDDTPIEQKNYGFYFIADQTFYTSQGYILSLFSQIGLSPKSKNIHNHFYSLGLNCKGIFGRTNDQAGLAVAYAGINRNALDSETALELTYLYQINEFIYLKPDIQYIINPSGTGRKLENALVGFLRLGIII